MCTCGIDIATQQATPASARSHCSAGAERPSVPGAAKPAAPPRRLLMRAAARGASVSASGTIVATQNRPMPTCVARQPDVAMKCCTIGGQIVPAR